jgi:hypothetical protein
MRGKTNLSFGFIESSFIINPVLFDFPHLVTQICHSNITQHNTTQIQLFESYNE